MDGIEKQFYPFADFCVSLFPVKAVNFRLRREGYPVVLGGISFGALVIFAGFGFKNVVCVTVQTGKPFRFIRVLRNGRLPVGTVLSELSLDCELSLSSAEPVLKSSGSFISTLQFEHAASESPRANESKAQMSFFISKSLPQFILLLPCRHPKRKRRAPYKVPGIRQGPSARRSLRFQGIHRKPRLRSRK